MKHTINSTNTKHMLVDALISLAKKKPISKITVSELSSYCNINRKTFYYHFADIYDLLEWHLNNEIQKAISTFNPLYDIHSAIVYSINYIEQHTYLKNILHDSIAKDKCTKLLNTAIYQKMKQTIESLESPNLQKSEPEFKDFLSKNLTHIIVLSLLDSIENTNPYDADTLEKYISRLIQMSTEGNYK